MRKIVRHLVDGVLGGGVAQQTLTVAIGVCKYTQENTPTATNATNVLLSFRGGTGSRRIGLLLPDLTGVSGTIISATLNLYNQSVETGNQSVSFHPILAANDGWGESTSTWSNKVTASTTKWAGDTGGDDGADAGCSVSGTDYNAAAIGTLSYVANTVVDTLHQVTLDPMMVQAWLTGNYGIVGVTATDNVIDFHSDDAANAALRPSITFVFRP